MSQLILGLIAFRAFESLIAMPIAFRFVPQIGNKRSIALSLVFQAAFIFLFPFAATSMAYFVLTLLVLSVFDVLYWPVRDNIERTVHGGTLASSVGLSRALSVLAQAVGLVLGGVGISVAGDTAFYVASIGILFSLLPIALLQVPASISPAQSFFATIAQLAQGTVPRIHAALATGILIVTACIKELVDIVLPLALAFFAIQIDTIGIALALFILAGFISNALLGRAQPRRRRTYFFALGIATLLIFLMLPRIPVELLPLAVATLGLASGPWLSITDIMVQTFVRRAFSRDPGGFFIEFADDAARIVPLGALLGAPLLAGPVMFLGFFATIGTVCSALVLSFGALAGSKLDR